MSGQAHTYDLRATCLDGADVQGPLCPQCAEHGDGTPAEGRVEAALMALGMPGVGASQPDLFERVWNARRLLIGEG